MTGKELLIAWLNDAHGMENALVEILEHQIKDAKDYPQVQAKLEQHLEQTRRHAQMVKDCVEKLGGSTSALNNHGEVVGVSEDANHVSLPFLWKNGVMTNLNLMLPPNSGWVLSSVSLIISAIDSLNLPIGKLSRSSTRSGLRMRISAGSRP